ncbi:hypothetical protein BV25DRAFT_1915734 [Artomyces pyxidatus]|uniref:Uncharacterized protein n=1 Tax=Artomyces pyxidatus TaxID=48021 RepID=A0ACB8T3D1_9AGAM|nr:hypothetical protein BV25DRAFT_1915734 [Artomyces pyxidatus]
MSSWRNGLDVQLTINYYLALVSFTILYYDYALTIIMEIDVFWPPKNRISFASVLYFLNRYLSVLGQVLVVYEIFVDSPTEHIALLQFLAAALCLLRVSALYDNHRAIIGLLATIILGCIGTVCWSSFAYHPHGPGTQMEFFQLPGVRGCNPLYPKSEALRLGLTWSGVLVFDVIVFILTFYKAVRIGGFRRPNTLFHLLLRDGTVYFVVLFLANLANILTFLLAPPLLKGINGLVTNVLSATLVSRLMLNLRVESAKLNEERMNAETLGIA